MAIKDQSFFSFFFRFSVSLSSHGPRRSFGLVVLLVAVLLGSLIQTAASNSLGVSIVRSPESAVAPKGDEVVFECELNLAAEELKWRFRHSSQRADDANNFQYLEKGYLNTNENKTSKLKVLVSPETLGDYQCVAWFGSAAIASIPARLTLVSISIDNSNGYAKGAIPWNVAPKNSVLLRCGTVTSNPPAVWTFYRNGEKIPQSEVSTVNGALILNSVSMQDSGNYTCSAMNAITGVEVKLPQRIDLRVDYTDRTKPFFLTDPPDQVTARPGDTVLLECPGVGSPPPIPVWSSPNVVNLFNNRTIDLPYGLQIVDVLPEDQGKYICRLDNGIAPPLIHHIKLVVLEKPTILRGPVDALTNEGNSLELECSAQGNPIPKIYWLINGEDTSQDPETFREDRHLSIKHVQKRHAGIVQCFAKNEVGEVSEANLLRVNPKQIQGESSATLGHVPVRQPHDRPKKKGTRKQHKHANMIPPSIPNVTRLSDDSVMLRWSVPKNNGLPIQFFKVQYRMVVENARKKKKETWQTTNEDIPFGKADWKHENIKNFTSSVTGLKPDHYYRFRIIAVYSNNDNKEGNTSVKFFLPEGSALGPSAFNLPAPDLVEVEPLSETAVILHWTLPATNNQIDGFYAYYRPASSAGDYLKATVDGFNIRQFQIDMLEPGTSYEFKLQSFNEMAASEFSSIKQGRTKKPFVRPSPTAPSVVPTTSANQEDNSIYPVVAGAAGGGLLLLIASIAACLCMKRRKTSQPEDEDKPQLDHIQADFVTPSVLATSPHHKQGHRLNGVIQRMNITPNPLAQEADKASSYLSGSQQSGLHHAQPYHQNSTPGTPTMMHKRNDTYGHQQPPPIPPHQNNNHNNHNTHNHHNNHLHHGNNHQHHPHHQQHNQNNQLHGSISHLPHHQNFQSTPNGAYHQQSSPPPLTPSLEHQRRTLDRSTRNLHSYNNPQLHHDNAAMNCDGLPTRIPSLRRTRRGSHNGNVHGSTNGGVGIPIVPGSPRVQRSPMPARAMIKRNRLGSHNDNISSGSLNSIEV